MPTKKNEIAMSSSPLWYIFNAVDGTHLDQLTYSEGRIAVAMIRPEERFQWFAWRQGWEAWRPLTATPELTATLTGEKKGDSPAPPASPKLTKKELRRLRIISSIDNVTPTGDKHLPQLPSMSAVSAFEVEGHTNTLTGDEKTEGESRRYGRRSARFRVEIVSGQRHFVSYTRDISLGGIRLEDPLPEWVAGYCTAIVARPGIPKPLEFLCTVVENQVPGDKHRIEIYPSGHTAELERWLFEVERTGRNRKKRSV